MQPRRLASLLGAFAVLHCLPADAITVARATRRGYILTDETGTYMGNLPVTNNRDMFRFIHDTTAALVEVDGFREGRYLAAMQVPQTQNPLAFYLPIRNDVRGIGQHSQQDARSEVFDVNAGIPTEFQLDGFVYLNSYRFYTDPRAVIFGRFSICTQEFGHRYGATMAAPPFPLGVPAGDGGVADASVTDASVTDASVTDASVTDASVADAAAGDASADGGGDIGPVPLTRDAFLGRGNPQPNGTVTNRAHWNYFFNTGGSPMEGNAWTEMPAGTFTTQRPTFRFSPIDLYAMGIIPATEVPLTFLIVDPQNVPRNVTRDSPPEYYNRQVTVRGRRVDVSIDDIVRANGPRVPAYPTADRDLDVVWVLLADEDQVNDDLAAEFDDAIDSCALGYTFATADRGHLVAAAVDQPDAAVPDDAVVEPKDASLPDVTPLVDVPNIPPPDGMELPDASVPADAPHVADVTAPPLTPTSVRAEGGCACSTTGPVGSRDLARALLTGAAALFCLRRRRRAAK